ncbi:MAG: TIM-barrel domain-containing protein [Prevotella sp.]
MRKLLLLGLLAMPLATSAQQSYMTDDSVAVFYPKGYDASQHLPSPIFLRELVPQDNVPGVWSLRPQFSTEGSKSYARFDVGDADLYGCGEVYGDLKRNGETVKFWNKDNGLYLVDGGKRLYQTHPWVLGVRKDGTAFGLIADNTWKSKVTTNSTVTFESEGPAFRVIVIERSNPLDVLQELGKLSGTISMPPLWSLGYQQSRFSYTPYTKAESVGETFRKKNIPCDVIWMDINYMDGFRIFTFSPQEIPNPKGFNKAMHDMKFKMVYMIDPAAKTDSSYFVYQQGTAADYWVKDNAGKPYVGKVWPGATVFPDFTRPEVRTWWSGLYKDFMATGIDGIWNDMNEPSNFEGPDGTLPEDAQHLGGEGLIPGPHLRYHNVYGYNMVKASCEGMLAAQPRKRPFLLSRSNFLGGQRYAATWTGDNRSSTEHMKMSIPMTLNMGLTGQPFNGPDIGGFADNCTAGLLAQWTALGVYFPFVRNHSTIETHFQEPWAFGKKTEDICRTAINRRYMLLPYFYTLFQQAHESGLPVMRPVFLTDLKDLSLRSEQQAFTVGSDLLVIPRWSKNPALPKGNWKTFRFEKKDDGYQAELSLRPGAAIPVANLYQNTEDYRTDSLTLIVNPDVEGKASGKLYIDSGNGFEYREGQYAKYNISASLNGSKLTVSLKQIAGKMDTPVKFIRVATIKKGRLVYSAWQESNEITVKI